MITYDYECPRCDTTATRLVQAKDRDFQVCSRCYQFTLMDRQLSAPLFKFIGRVVQGGGPDRFTADMLDIPWRELPDEMKAKRKGEK